MAGILIFYEPLPEELRRSLEVEAFNREMTTYDLVRTILSDRYRLEFTSSGLPYRQMGERFKLRVSPELRMRIGLEAAEKRGTIRGVVLSALANHYGLAPIDQGRRPRGATA